MKREPQPPRRRGGELLPFIFCGLFGAFLGLALLKFGNPPIMEKWVTTPSNGWELVFSSPWPIAWAYRLLIPIFILGMFCARWNLHAPRWLVALPLAWLLWQFVAGTQTVDAELTQVTVKHFTACVACFYLGLFALGGRSRLWPFWVGLLGAFLLVLAVGWEQHFGGLEETRRYFFLYVYPQMKEVPPEYFKKMSSNRIFSTLFYPNALAGAVLLLLPIMLGAVHSTRERFTTAAKWFLAAAIALGGLACLFWSGSKGGWLLMLLLGVVVLLRFPLSKRQKFGLLAAVLVIGLVGFFLRYSGFFKKGATSVSARFDYWEAAARTTAARPVFGSGPGTFFIPYQKIKRPESEPSRLVHNDYLEQASDSGLPGFLTYTLFIVGGLCYLARGDLWPVRSAVFQPRALRTPSSSPTSAKPSMSDVAAADWLTFAVWLGLFGWACQGFLEFGLYMPALAWPAFSLMGWLLGKPRNPIDKPAIAG